LTTKNHKSLIEFNILKKLFLYFVFLKKSDAKLHKIFYKIILAFEFLLKNAL